MKIWRVFNCWLDFVICLRNFLTLGKQFCHFFQIWASLQWWREAQIRRKCEKIEKHSKMKAKKGQHFSNNSIFHCVFFCEFLEEVAAVFKIEATSGYFSSYVAAKLGSWKLVFRQNQTLLFRVVKGWVGTSWATFSNIFSGTDVESWFYYVFEKLSVQA